MRHVESTTQQAFIRWFRLAYARYALVAIAVPNGGARSRVEAAIMQGEGVTAGVADVLVLVPRGGYGALGLEFKTTARSRAPRKRHGNRHSRPQATDTTSCGR